MPAPARGATDRARARLGPPGRTHRSLVLKRRAAADPAAPDSVAACLAKWQRDHAGLHDYATLREEFDRRFRQRYFAWTPYLYGELGGAVEQEERALIDAGAIHATGFHYVGERSMS